MAYFNHQTVDYAQSASIAYNDYGKSAVMWQCMVRGEWKNYEYPTASAIETEYAAQKKQKSFRCSVGGEIYIINLKHMVQINRHSGYRRRIRRITHDTKQHVAERPNRVEQIKKEINDKVTKCKNETEIVQCLWTLLDEIRSQKQEKKEDVPMTIDFSSAEKGMCSKGHSKYTDENRCNCSECGAPQNVRKCYDCYRLSLEQNQNDDNDDEKKDDYDDKSLFSCDPCRHKQMDQFLDEHFMNALKARLVRNEIQKKPWIALDLLCGIPTLKGLEKLMDDIMRLEKLNRSKYVLFLIDIDNLKALNSTLGHLGADKVIERVGKILKKYTKEVNDRKWVKKGNGNNSLYRAWCFRQGGDEFAVVVECENYGEINTRLCKFYQKWRDEINDIMKKDEMQKLLKDGNIEKGKRKLKERGRTQLITAVNGVNMDEETKNDILHLYDKHVNEKDIEFSVDRIGVSVGLFFGNFSLGETREQEWIKCAEKAQDAAKEMPGKNQIRVYYEGYEEGKGGVIPSHSTVMALKYGCLYATNKANK